MQTFFYTGRGQQLSSSTGATKIAAGGVSESFAGHGCLEISFALDLDAASAANVDIEYSPTPDFASSEVYASIAMGNKKHAMWSAGKILSGYFRLKNLTAANLTAYLQKLIAS